MNSLHSCEFSMLPPVPGLRLGLAPRLLLLLGGSSEGFPPPFSVLPLLPPHSLPTARPHGCGSRRRWPPRPGPTPWLRLTWPAEDTGRPGCRRSRRQELGAGENTGTHKMAATAAPPATGAHTKGTPGAPPARGPPRTPPAHAATTNEKAPPRPSATHL